MRVLATKPSSNDFALDATGFALGLGLAWWLGWQTRDLVWNLWLSSLAIGYLTLVLAIGRAGRGDPRAAGMGGLAAKLFLLGFFTVHFGMFHAVHSVFLNIFFPLRPGEAGVMSGAGASFVGDRPGFGSFFPDYGAVIRNGWPWLIAAAIAERRSLWPPDPALGAPNLFAPYASVIRMHLLLFFFAATHFVGLDGIVVYAVVYTVYFWPWRRTLSLAPEPAAAA